MSKMFSWKARSLRGLENPKGKHREKAGATFPPFQRKDERDYGPSTIAEQGNFGNSAGGEIGPLRIRQKKGELPGPAKPGCVP